MVSITTLGNAGIIWLIIAAFLMATKKYRRFGLFMFVAMGLAFLIGNLGMKNLIARPRPCWRHPEVPILVELPKDFSFPSGHTMHSVIGAFGVWKANKHMGIAAFILAGLIAISRIYLYVHYPTDVLGGLLIGLLIAMGVWYVGEHYEVWNFKKSRKKG